MWTHEGNSIDGYRILRNGRFALHIEGEPAAREFCEAMNEYQQRTLPDVPETPPKDAA